MGSQEALVAADLRRVMVAYRDVLLTHQQVINRLNVYPVPDGDTGTNMARTLEAVVEELDGLGPDESMVDVCRAMAHGSLMGARGNSGVILSQFLRGLADRFGRGATVGSTDMAEALVHASDLAYEAVMRPVEGTILTVARAAGEGASTVAAAGDRLVGVAAAAHRAATVALADTPNQLEVLAKAGVVDAGGAALVLLFDALLLVLDGRPMPDAPPLDSLAPGAEMCAAEEGLAGGPRYEVMYLLSAPDDTIGDFKEVWAGLGDSIVVVGGDGLWNCHIHTDDIGAAVEAALESGRPRSIRVTDLHEQVEEERWVREGAAASEPELAGPPPTTGVVAVVTGGGVGRIFRSLGVHHQVLGGQSMNPSTAEILAVVEQVGSDEVVILPNNANIIPVAEQVDSLSDKVVRVVPTKSIVEGFAALLSYDPAAESKANAEAMAGSASHVVSAEVTRAVRDAPTEAGPVRAGDWMGLSEDGVLSIGDSPAAAACPLLERLIGPRHELVTLIEGEGATPGDTRRISQWLSDRHPSVSIEVHHGGQPLYPYLLGIE
ncbi:MAG TPA: DAK2 domain-containing protein [Acidimicrobiales bacterium]|nr:DAK2 domain-containing protein [Acidimicrobiales bacterium]